MTSCVVGEWGRQPQFLTGVPCGLFSDGSSHHPHATRNPRQKMFSDGSSIDETQSLARTQVATRGAAGLRRVLYRCRILADVRGKAPVAWGFHARALDWVNPFKTVFSIFENHCLEGKLTGGDPFLGSGVARVE